LRKIEKIKKVHHRDTETQRRSEGKENKRTRTRTREQENKGVIPAKAGIHLANTGLFDRWIPAFAGMTTAGMTTFE